MLSFPLLLVMSLFLTFYTVKSFQPVRLHTISKHKIITTRILPQMGLFDFLGPKKSASASHILVKGTDAKEKLTSLKSKLSSSKNMAQEFAEAASQYSACPSGKKGGALGTFKQGQMVPAFDAVVFKEEIGVIHGPISTPFGYHLILIDSRSD